MTATRRETATLALLSVPAYQPPKIKIPRETPK